MIESFMIWLIAHLFSDFSFILALIFIVHLLRSDKSPSTTFAWFFLVLLVPYLGVPLYILFGGRKMKQMTSKKNFIWTQSRAVIENEDLELPGRIGALFAVHHKDYAQTLLTGHDAYSKLVESIQKAKEHICISTFILGDDETGKAIVELLVEKLKEGIKVYLLIDALGASFLSRVPKLKSFKEYGGEVTFFMPMIHWPLRGRANLRNHRKIFLVDFQIAIMGGMNIASEYMGPEDHPKRWRDLCVVVEGDVVRDLYQVFKSDWEFASKSDFSPAVATIKAPFKNLEQGQKTRLQLVPSGPDVEGDPLHESIISMIFTAQKSIVIVTPYFIPDDLLLQALCIAARKGIHVRLIIPNVSNHWIADLARNPSIRILEKSGAAIYRYTSGMIHGKLITIDDEISIVGSVNMDMRSLFLNYEIALFIHSREKFKEFERWSLELIENSETGIKKANSLQEFFEDLTRLFSPLL